MVTYLVLNVVFLGTIAIGAYIFRREYVMKPVAMTFLILLVLTMVFDNLIIKNGIVAYDESLITGVKLLSAPVEDFAYSIGAVLLMPILWKVTAKK